MAQGGLTPHDERMNSSLNALALKRPCAGAQPPVFTSSQSHNGGIVASIGRAIGYLTAVGSALLGLGGAVVFWIFAAAAYDGTTLFGCSDGSKHPDQAAGNTCAGIGFAALATGLLVAYGITWALRRTTTP